MKSHEDRLALLRRQSVQFQSKLEQALWVLSDVEKTFQGLQREIQGLTRDCSTNCNPNDSVTSARPQSPPVKAAVPQLKNGAQLDLSYRHAVSRLQWNQVIIEILDGETIEIKVPNLRPVKLHFAAFGLADGRNGNKPNKVWALLLILGENEGVLPPCGEEKKTVSRLRNHLRTFLGIEEDPFFPFERKEEGQCVRNYRVRFTLTDVRRSRR